MKAASMLLLAIIGFYWKLTLTRQFMWAGAADALPGFRAGYLLWYFVLIHWIAALAVFALCRALRIGTFAATAGGLAFALSGVMGLTGHPARAIPIVLLTTGAALAARFPTRLVAAGCAAFAAVCWMAVARTFPAAGYAEHHSGSVNPVELGSAVLPGPHGREDLYLGTIVCAVALTGLWRGRDHPWTRIAAAICGLALLYSFGVFTGLQGVIYALFSRVAPVPLPSAPIPVFQLGVALLFAQGLDSPELQRERWIRWLCATIGVIALFSSQVLNWSGHTADLERIILSGWCALAASWILPHQRYVRAGLIGLMLIELTGHANTIIAAR